MVSGFKAYPFDEFEKKWQNYWLQNKTFQTKESQNKTQPKYYILDMFPYPSGAGLHVGHPEGYTATDILARYKRMKGFNVLHPIGWDAFGLPAEQYAIDTGTHPAVTTKKNIDNFRRQIQMLGFSYDWDREVNTTDPDYFKWTQWIFLQLFKRGLAYESEIPVWWCEGCKAVLANEEVRSDGTCDRKGHKEVFRRPLRQWVLKITAYAERLLEDLKLVDWSEAIKEMQHNWIGKSFGAEVDFKIANGEAAGETLRVFTTRPDTLFGATYMVVAPEHPLLEKLTDAGQRDVVEKYRRDAAKKSELERTQLEKDKTGVWTGSYAINPVNAEKIPVWVADYVMMGYGTGAIMAVPAHDTRDYEFAQKFKLPVIQVVQPENEKIDWKGFTDNGISVNSTGKEISITGLKTPEAKEKITTWLEENGLGKASIQYKLRDWLFSRQRYWGEPIPIVHCETCGAVPVPENELPLRLPEMTDYTPSGSAEPPLAKAIDWVNCKCPKCQGAAKRETNTMPQWAGSCWYYLRYIDPQNQVAFVDKEKEKYWSPVDLYVGGAEHAVLHLLYSRFWHKVLFDIGAVSSPEPFLKLVNQGMILGEDNQKMSKSRGNVINPDDVVSQYGADAFRLYEMFMGPLEMTKPWSTSGVEGVYRFLGKVWRLFIDKDGNFRSEVASREPDQFELKILHQTIKKVTEDLDNMRFNTAISALMIFVNEISQKKDFSRAVLSKFILLLAPFAPHIAEELWEKLGNKKTIAYEMFPKFDEKYLIEAECELAILIGGKVRAKIVVSRNQSEEEIKKLALENPKIKEFVTGKIVKKIIIVPSRTVNIVVANA